MTNELAGRICTPCRGGVPPMTGNEAKQYVEQTPGWALLSEGTRIQRTFKFANFKAALNFVDKVGACRRTGGASPGHPLRMGLLHHRTLYSQDQRPA